MQKLFAAILSLIIIQSLPTLSPVCAITKTPTPTSILTILPTPSTTINPKIDEIRQALTSKVKQIRDTMEKRGFIGIVKEITGSTIIINNHLGTQRLITDETTSFVASNKKEVRLADLAIGDKLIALGFLSDTNELTAVRISVVAPTAPPAERLAVIGQITQTDPVKSTLTFASEGKQAATQSYKVDKNSKYSPATEEKLSVINIKNLPVNRRAVLVYQVINKVLTIKSLFYLD